MNIARRALAGSAGRSAIASLVGIFALLLWYSTDNRLGKTRRANMHIQSIPMCEIGWAWLMSCD